MIKIFSALVLLALTSGCTHLASVSTTSIPPQREKAVHAEASKFIFMGFNFNNEYVNNLVTDLAKQCPRGKVQGILTKHENIMYFPGFAHRVRVTADGYCVQAKRRRRQAQVGGSQ